MWLVARFRNFDWVLIGALAVLALASLLALYSYDALFFWKQFAWYVLAFLVIFLGGHISWRQFVASAWFRYGLYWVSIAFLIFSNLQSRLVRGTKSWISFGWFQFEPIELAKLALIFIFANFFSRKYVAAWQGKNIIVSFLYTILPAGLAMLHPDFGSAVTVMCLWFGFLLMSGVHKKRFLIGLIAVVLIVIALWVFVFKPYQKDRVLGFIFPDRDPLGANYNVIQSKIAIGSAGLWGKGFLSGTQAQLHFLPEAQTDFLFATFIEEWGIFGGLVLLTAFMLIVYRLVRLGMRVNDNTSRFLILGTGVFLLVHFFINTGSNIGLMPVAGITFPFFSYGGSNLLTTATLMSIMENTKLELH